MLYRFTQNYRSSVLTASVGDVVELDDELVAWLAVDSPGTVVAHEDKAETRAVETPPSDRMQRKPQARDDRGGGEAISKETFKAVKS